MLEARVRAYGAAMSPSVRYLLQLADPRGRYEDLHLTGGQVGDGPIVLAGEQIRPDESCPGCGRDRTLLRRDRHGTAGDEESDGDEMAGGHGPPQGDVARSV